MAETRVEDLTAADVMQTDLATCSLDDTLQEALDLMTENHVTGLPVADGSGQCVGVVSATDLLTFEEEHGEEVEEPNEDVTRYFDPETERWEDLRPTAFAMERLGRTPVSEVVSRDVVSCREDTSLTEVATKMVAAGVHRIVVLDEEGGLQGIVSAFDFVRAIADRVS